MHSQVKQSLIDSWKSEFLDSNPFEISVFLEGDDVDYAAGGDTPDTGSVGDPEMAFEVWKEEGFQHFSCFRSTNNFFKVAQIASFEPIPEQIEMFVVLGLKGRSPATYLQKPDDAYILFCDEYTKANGTLRINYLG